MTKLYQLTILIFAFFLIGTAGVSAQNYGTITGRINTSDNKPADNVSVKLQGTRFGATTTENGLYTLRAPAGSYTLVVSQVGVQSVQTQVTITAGQTVNVPALSINTSVAELNEVNISTNRANRYTRKVSTDAAKIPLTNLENAQSYSTVTNELLKEQQVFTVDDALKNVPGIQKLWDATGRGGDGGAYFTLRGFTVQSSLRNGVAGLVTNTVDGVNVDKVEVIKGPSGTLYGSTLPSFGGLINRVTKKPYETFGAEITHSLGSYDLNRTAVDVNTPLDAKKNVLFRVNSAYNYRSSFQNYGKARSFTFAPSLSIKANDRLSFLLESEMFFGRSSSMRPFFFFYSSPKDLGVTKVSDLNINYNQAYVADDVTQRSRSLNYFAQANYKISDKITSQTVFTSSNSFSNGASPYFYLLTDELAAGLAATIPGAAIPANLPGQGNYILRNDQSTANSKLNAIEVQENINGDFNIGSLRNRFVVGLDYQRVSSNQIFVNNQYDIVPINNPAFNYGSFNKLLQYSVSPTTLTAQNTFPYIYKTNTYSAYVSDVINLTEQLLASAGVRVDRFENKGTHDITGKQLSDAYSQTAVSPKFGLVYQALKDQLSFFANYQNGFINPTPFTNASGATVSPKVQNANQVEGGVKMALFNGKLNGTISYYSIKLSNVLRPVIGGANNAQVQDGTQSSKGFETEITANPLAGVYIVAGFAYNNAKFTKASADVEGLRPNTAGSPYLANFYVSYRLPQTAVKGLGIGFGGNYASQNKVINSVSQGTFSLPSYTVLNANVFLDRTKYRFGLTANNVGNKHYYTGFTTINPQDLRQFILSAAYKF